MIKPIAYNCPNKPSKLNLKPIEVPRNNINFTGSKAKFISENRFLNKTKAVLLGVGLAICSLFAGKKIHQVVKGNQRKKA